LINKNLYNRIISSKVKQLIIKQNISNEYFFECIGISKEQGNMILKDEIEWDLFVIHKIINKFEIDIEKIIPSDQDINEWITNDNVNSK